MTTPPQRLLLALDALDSAFAPLLAEPSPTVGGCTHCYADADLAALAGPAQVVPDRLISSVARMSVDHWDDFASLYRRMTPRIVRLLATGRLHLDHGLIASRLLAAHWREWPAPERQALEQVWDDWWRSTLHAYPATDPATAVLETVAVSTGILTPWLAIWAETRTEAADRHLDDALDHWIGHWPEERRLAGLRLGFYDELLVGPELVDWLLSLDEGRIGAAQLFEVERIAYS
ncbi:hypothetical protein CFP65_6548 [Kitasatospora sp. MMS16-BH015]|uniref:hypothetical protein n=1 Tax=Kitasatospora sp. MMS16-BH015 TaxID=2018025 RepID=UPI000CA137EC|nr:hypothetical protein [Kitasatospora sp. MMS16-BH015]AUG81198.1 hypothetical protein CFP65_6548 [Kitasatospora sp. MMS16-BH015]